MNEEAEGLVELIESMGYKVVATAADGVAVAGAASTEPGSDELHIAGGSDEVTALTRLARELGFVDLD